jgi:hypothetical protein
LGTTKEAWKAEQLRIAQRYTKARPLVDQIENRETMTNTEIDLTEEWVQRNKASSDERARVLKSVTRKPVKMPNRINS